MTCWLRQNSYCLSILIEGSWGSILCLVHTDTPSSGILRLSQQTYIKRILKRFNMQSCSSGKAPIVKGDRFSKCQCTQNTIKRDQMKAVFYSSVVGSLMYAQVCTRSDITFVVGVLGKYLSDLGQSHWKAAKKILRYL